MALRKIAYFYPEEHDVGIPNYNTEIAVISQDGKAFNVSHILLNTNGEHFRPSLNQMSVSNPLDAETYLEELFKIYKERHSNGLLIDCDIEEYENEINRYLAQAKIENPLNYPIIKYEYFMKIGKPRIGYVNGLIYKAKTIEFGLWVTDGFGLWVTDDDDNHGYFSPPDVKMYFTSEFDI